MAQVIVAETHIAVNDNAKVRALFEFTKDFGIKRVKFAHFCSFKRQRLQ